MPDVRFVISEYFRTRWQGYWERRPYTQAPDLARTLLDSEVLEDPASRGFRTTAGRALWVHPALPNRAIMVAPQGEEWSTLTIITSDRTITPAGEVQGHDEPLLPRFEPIPQGATLRQRRDMLVERLHAVKAWLASSSAANARRAVAFSLERSIAAEIDAIRQQVHEEEAEAAALRRQKRDEERRKALADDTSEADHIVLREDGRYALHPAVRWLLREVKDLRRRVEELEGS